MKSITPVLRSLLLVTTAIAACGSPVTPYAVSAKLQDAVQLPEPGQVRVDGWLGRRIDVNTTQRLAVVDTVPLLAGFKQKPGEHPWIGEHVGKWLHAATLAWHYTGDAALRAKLDDVVRQLIAAQEKDGYLGTYIKAERLGLHRGADWDVWSHKYCMIGLLTYHRYTGDKAALEASRRAAELLMATFPSQKSILAAGTHVGMAATSVLEPIMMLYRFTGDERHLAFARYIVQSWDEPGGPGIVKSLLTTRRVDRTANGKAYEMLSNLVGLAEYARVTGETRCVAALENAWTDIVDKRLYITGSASCYELFSGDHELPNGVEAHPGETCVTTTWLQFNRELLRLAGEARYADEMERSMYNHLAAAQHPDGHDWCYYTALEGKKQYDEGITCCHSSGPRGLALAPTVAYFQNQDTIYVSTFETSRATLTVGGQPVELELRSEFPRNGRAVLTVRGNAGAPFALAVRAPEWAGSVRVGEAEGRGGWVRIPPRAWKNGETVELAFTLGGRVVPGEYTNYARTAYAWGPFILALDKKQNPETNPPEMRAVRSVTPQLASDAKLEFKAAARGPWDNDPREIVLVPFADAGAAGTEYRVWLRTL